MRELIAKHCKALKLGSRIVQNYKNIQAQTHEEFLEKLLAMEVEACNQGRHVRFFRTAALVNQLMDAKAEGNLKRFLKQLDRVELLICDEWGFIPFEREGSQLLFQVISDCYERKSMIITTNLEFSKWNGIFYDEKLTSAIIDRIIHHSHLIVFDGPSERLVNSLMRKQ